MNSSANSTPYGNEALSLENSKKSSRDVEIYYGPVGLMAAQWRERWEELPASTAVAMVIVVLATIVGLGCFVVAFFRPRRR